LAKMFFTAGATGVSVFGSRDQRSRLRSHSFRRMAA